MSIITRGINGGGKKENRSVIPFYNVSDPIMGEINKLGDLPREHYGGGAVVYNGNIHILGGDGSNNLFTHYKWDGLSWTKLNNIPIGVYMDPVVCFNDEIHIIDSNNHYKWDGSSWTKVSSGIESAYRNNYGTVVYNGCIHILGSDSGSTSHYKWDESSWTSVSSSLPYSFENGGVVVYKNQIHILGGRDGNYSGYTYHYKWDGSSWTSVSSLNNPFYLSSAIVYNDRIYLFGGSGFSKQIQMFNGNDWSPYYNNAALPYSMYQGFAVIYDNKIVLGGGQETIFYNPPILHNIITCYLVKDTNIYTELGCEEISGIGLLKVPSDGIYNIYCDSLASVTIFKENTLFYFYHVDNNFYYIYLPKGLKITILDDNNYRDIIIEESRIYNLYSLIGSDTTDNIVMMSY